MHRLPQYVCIALLLLVRRRHRRVLPAPPGGHGVADAPRFLVVLRTASVALAVFLALDPSIVANRVIPGEQVVILLFDDSQSMRIVGEDRLSRGERLLRAYNTAGESFESTLKRKHQVARYRLGTSIEPLQEFNALKFRRAGERPTRRHSQRSDRPRRNQRLRGGALFRWRATGLGKSMGRGRPACLCPGVLP